MTQLHLTPRPVDSPDDTTTASAQYATVATPDGPFTIVLNARGILASGWTADVASLVTLIHPTLRPALADIEASNEQTNREVDVADTAVDISTAIAAVAAYYNGDLEAPGRLPVQQVSGEFRMHAWDVLREVAPGERITYSEYASRAGRPTAVRAAAGACALNAAALFVPCHRVLRTDGTLGGFRYGLEIKERLLDREAGIAVRGRP